MKCISCRVKARDAGTCIQCYEEAKAKVAFLNLPYPSSPSFSDVVLVASNFPVPVQAHKAVLASRSPVFRAMLIDNQMLDSFEGLLKGATEREALGGTIKIEDVSYKALCAFVKYLYTAVITEDEEMARDLLILAEKYQVQHLKDHCEKFLVSKLNWDNSVTSYKFAQQHNAKKIMDAALSLITDNMDKLTSREDYAELVENDPKLAIEIYEAHLSKQINTAAHRVAFLNLPFCPTQ